VKNPLLYRALVVLTSALIGAGAVATSAHAGGNGNTGGYTAKTACTSLEAATYTHTFDGPTGKASITLTNGPLCAGLSQAFALVAYTAPAATFQLPQFVMDSSVKYFTAPKSEGELIPSTLEFQVEVPTCYAQVDFVKGERVISPLKDKNDLYGSRKVAYWNGNGGNGVCTDKPEATPLSDCDGNVDLKLINREGNLDAKFEITGDEGFKQTVTVKHKTIGDLHVPAANAKNIVVTVKGKQIWQGGWTKPEDCQKPEVGKPEAALVSTCDGLVFTLKNPANGVDVTVTLTPNKGEAKTVTVKPGESAGPITFPGEEGLAVTVSGDLDVANGVVTWTKPEDCASPSASTSTSASASPSPSTSTSASASATPSATVSTTPVSSNENLPKTGSAVSTWAAGAGLLLIIGGVLFFLARRRRVDFTT